MRKILATLVILSCLIVGAELGLRAALAVGWYEPTSQQALDRNATPNRKFNGKMQPSANPILAMEYRLTDPNINNVGHRGFDFNLEKPANTLRLALLGDSVAYGNSVPFDETFSQRLASYLSARAQREYGVDIQLYNFAVSVYGTAAEAELYRVKVRNYQPDFVLLAYTLNDPMPNDFVLGIVREARKNVNNYQQLLSRSQLLAWATVKWQQATQQRRNIARYQSFFTGDLWRENQRQLQQMRDDIAADNRQFAAVVVPMMQDFAQYPFTKAHQLLADQFKQLEVPLLDLLPPLSQYPYMDLRPHPKDDAHPNSLGHQVIADSIGPWLWPQLVPLLEKIAAENQAAIGTPE